MNDVPLTKEEAKAERDAADYAKLRAELQAALADNAALVEALRSLRGRLLQGGFPQLALANTAEYLRQLVHNQPHPGSALLAERDSLLKRVGELEAENAALQDRLSAEQEDHEATRRSLLERP